MKKIYVVFSLETHKDGVRQRNGFYTFKPHSNDAEIHPCIDGTFSSKAKAQEYCLSMVKEMCERWRKEWGEAWNWEKNKEKKGWFVSANRVNGGAKIKYYILPTELNNMNDFALIDIYSECDPF